MISRSETKSLLKEAPAFDDIMCSLRAAPKLPRAMVGETRKVVALARKFNREVVIPYALELDKQMQQNPDYLPWEFVEKANRWGVYTMWIPRIFGGKGYNLPSLSYFLEEIGSQCLAMANLIGVHYLGVATLFSSWNIRLINQLCRETAEGEKNGKPCLMSLAITEPGAGTDVEEVDLVDQGTVTCHVQKVPGGYKINGTKIFISNGHLSTWHMLIAYSDLKNPSRNTVMLAVKTGTEGFSFGRMEHKMGQKGCPASELIFKDCFVSDEYVASDPEQSAKMMKSVKATTQQLIDYVVSTTRAAVGAFGTGAARGAYEEALKFALETEVDGKLLANHEWAQCFLAEMYKNVTISRLSYAETNYANGMVGMFKIIQMKPLFYYFKYFPFGLIKKILLPILDHPAVTWLFRKMQMDWQSEEEVHRTSGWASLAKVVGTDFGIRNCQLALEFMGQAGLRHDRRTEKIMRDAKLLQIYEGTNQLNRVNLFKCLIGRNYPQINVFAKEQG